MGKSKYLGIVIRDYSVFANQQLQILLQYHNFPSSEQIDLQHLAWFPYCCLHLMSNHRAVGIFKRWVPLLHPYDYHAMLVTDVVHRNHSWVGELAASLPLLETCMTASAQEYQGHVSERHGITIKSLLPLEYDQDPQQQAGCFSNDFDKPGQISEGFTCMVFWLLLCGISLLEGIQ